MCIMTTTIWLFVFDNFPLMRTNTERIGEHRVLINKGDEVIMTGPRVRRVHVSIFGQDSDVCHHRISH